MWGRPPRPLHHDLQWPKLYISGCSDFKIILLKQQHLMSLLFTCSTTDDQKSCWPAELRELSIHLQCRYWRCPPTPALWRKFAIQFCCKEEIKKCHYLWNGKFLSCIEIYSICSVMLTSIIWGLLAVHVRQLRIACLDDERHRDLTFLFHAFSSDTHTKNA